MKGRTLLLTFFAVIFVLTPSFASKIIYPDYSGFVNDYAGVLSPATKQQLETVCRELEKKTTSELAIAIVKTVEPSDPKTYAVKLFEKWKIGKKGKDNGVLILLAMEERRIEIEVGYGLEGALTDSVCGRVLDVFAVPNFKQGKMGEGVLATAQAVAKLAEGETFDRIMPSIWTAALIKQLALLVLAEALLVWLYIFLIKKKIGFFPTMCGVAIGADLGFIIASFFNNEDVTIILAMVLGYVGLFAGLFIELMVNGGSGGGGGGGGSSGSSYSSSSSSSSSGSSSSSSSSSFGGGSSGGGGAGRSW